jgi:hypothetical protein
MSEHADSNSGDLQPKLMKGKYDGRKTNGRYKSAVKRGPKPLWLHHMGRNTAAKILKELDSIASPAEIYQAAWAKGNHALCFEMRRYANDRLFGKPFTAENPVKAKTADPMAQDSRLRDAIKELLPGARKTVM